MGPELFLLVMEGETLSVHHGKEEGAGLRRWSFDRGLPHQQLHVLAEGRQASNVV